MASTAISALRRVLITSADLEKFIGPNAAPYVDFWRQENVGKPRFSIFWLALLTPLPWMMYRKMYGLTAIMVLAPLAIGMVAPDANLEFGFPFVFALLAKPAYLRHAEAKIRKICMRTTEGPERDAQLARAGGVSVGASVVGVVLYVALIFAAIQSLS